MQRSKPVYATLDTDDHGPLQLVGRFFPYERATNSSARVELHAAVSGCTDVVEVLSDADTRRALAELSSDRVTFRQVLAAAFAADDARGAL